jgi:hypothetical protein
MVLFYGNKEVGGVGCFIPLAIISYHRIGYLMVIKASTLLS